MLGWGHWGGVDYVDVVAVAFVVDAIVVVIVVGIGRGVGLGGGAGGLLGGFLAGVVLRERDTVLDTEDPPTLVGACQVARSVSVNERI